MKYLQVKQLVLYIYSTFLTYEVDDGESLATLTNWLIGVSMLFVSLFLASLLGHLQVDFLDIFFSSDQEWSYTTYGKGTKTPWQESLFYSHVLGIPYFAFFYKDIVKHFYLCNQSLPLDIFGYSIPSAWVYLSINVATQYPY
jgi:hypothetical protein